MQLRNKPSVREKEFNRKLNSLKKKNKESASIFIKELTNL